VRRIHIGGAAGAALVAAAAGVVSSAASCRTVPHEPVRTTPVAFSVESRVAPPLIRVGLADGAPRAEVVADSGVAVWITESGAAPVRVAAPVANFRPVAPGSPRLKLLETGRELDSAIVEPASASEALSVDGIPYRGLIEIRGNGGGSLTIINIVNMEDYLRGVVPNELSPHSFPRMEALKAQAVAARTYALRNRGQFAAKGYDICATAACQVYKGRSTEDPLSDRAVEETRGIAATYRGMPIDALYTSTCGGHTEDGENIFEGESLPYLRGVACIPERSAWSSLHTKASPAWPAEDEGLNRDAALLAALGVLEPRAYSAGYLRAPASDAELRGWTTRLVGVLRRQECESKVASPITRRGGFFRHLVSSLCWEERGERLLSPGDTDYLLQVEDRGTLDGPEESLAAAVLIQEGVLSPFPDNTLGADKAVTRAQAVTLLARAAERAGVPGLVAADFQDSEQGDLTTRNGEAVQSVPLDPDVRLFRSLDGVHAAASELTLAAGDPVDFVVQNGRVAFLEAEQSRLGAASDRTSRYYRWESRLTPADLKAAVARYADVGTVEDIVPRRIGVSGRVVELSVVGERGEVLLKGLKIRTALGLRENLFVVERELDGHGAVAQFVFVGKGWGHGVGLCQVGASGMAQAGATYDKILRHYYRGITLAQAN